MKLVTSRFTHYALLIAFLQIAFFFRTYQLAGLGLGLEQDEVAEWQIANSIRHGENALFFKEAYGQEPLFLYLMAGSTALIGDNAIGVRFTAVFVAMLTLAAVYRMLRRMFSPFVALIALAGMSIALWPVFWGRVGLRAMTLPLMLCFAFDFLWRGLTTDNRPQTTVSPPSLLRPFIITGIFFGLSAYTYLSSRAIPILLISFVLYLALFARDRMRGRWRNLFVSFAIAILVALPLAITVITNPDLQFRVSEVSGPLDQAMKGDTRALFENIPLAFGMFTLQGDHTVRDNWPNRPVFPEPIGQALFMIGFVIALSKFKQPRYALSLIWLGSMLIPSMVTSGAPNFTRTLGALPVAFALPAIGLEWLSMWPLRMLAMSCAQKLTRLLEPFAIVFLIGVFAVNAVSTFDDYFNKWPNQPETQFVFQADFAAIAKDIDANTVMDISVGGLSNDTMDDDSLRLLLQRKDVRVRWFDSGSPISSGGALLEPIGAFRTGYVYIPAIVPFDPDIKDYPFAFMHGASLSDKFTRYSTDAYPIPNIIRAEYSARYFDDTASLLVENTELPWTIAAGNDLRFMSQWFARNPIVYPRRIFVHLVDPKTQSIVAQHDGLDSPTKFWRNGDWILQVHHLSIPTDTPIGQYEVWIGLYDPVTGKRVLQTNSKSDRVEPPSEQYMLGTIQVTH